MPQNNDSVVKRIDVRDVKRGKRLIDKGDQPVFYPVQPLLDIKRQLARRNRLARLRRQYHTEPTNR